MNKEFVAGAVSGLAQNIVGHPFDTAKVYIQNDICLLDLKPYHYYRGFVYPTLFSIFSTGIVFSVNNYIVQEKKQNNYMGGFIAGLSVSPMCYLFDLLKIKKQIPSSFCSKMPGLSATFIRESLAFGMWFGSYYDLTKKYNFSAFFGGGISGILAWTVTYPIDVIKNRQMAQNKSFLVALNEGRLWKGYGLCIARAAVVNSIGFSAYEHALTFLHNDRSTYVHD